MGKSSKITKEVSRITEGMFASLADMTLFFLYFGLEFGTTLGSKRQAMHKGLRFANESIEKINYRSIKRSIHNLKRKGFLKYLKRELITADKITSEGIEKIKSLTPKYNSQRTWDGRIYLVSYDIPSKPAGKRDILREFLKRIKCGFLQQSVWLTCYNPKRLIKALVKKHHIPGQILISDLGPDGSVGEKDIKTLLQKTYNLESLNSKYQNFIKRFKKVNNKNSNLRPQAAFSFLSILKEDPQIPFPLLPHDWVGEKAYSLYQKFLPKRS